MNDARQNRMHGIYPAYQREGTDGISIRAIKEHPAKDAPVVIGMMVGGSFITGNDGQGIVDTHRTGPQPDGFQRSCHVRDRVRLTVAPNMPMAKPIPALSRS